MAISSLTDKFPFEDASLPTRLSQKTHISQILCTMCTEMLTDQKEKDVLWGLDRYGKMEIVCCPILLRYTKGGYIMPTRTQKIVKAVAQSKFTSTV